MGKLTENIKGTANEVVGKVKQHSSDADTRAEGFKQELKGQVQKAKGDIQGALGDKI
ncbi:MAG: CsbD family protein [Erythrobacter sp.]|nr:CsbD family protein [Erythrobacter sp.]